MKKYLALLLFPAVLLAFFSCKKKSTASKVPKIELKAMFPDSLKSGDPNDTVTLQISVVDGDGDLGIEEEDRDNVKFDLYLKDQRDTAFIGYYFPNIDKEVKNNGSGLEGDIYFFVRGDFVFTRDDSLHTAAGDTTLFELYIKDKAGNESNHITTGTMYIRP